MFSSNFMVLCFSSLQLAWDNYLALCSVWRFTQACEHGTKSSGGMHGLDVSQLVPTRYRPLNLSRMRQTHTLRQLNMCILRLAGDQCSTESSSWLHQVACHALMMDFSPWHSQHVQNTNVKHLVALIDWIAISTITAGAK